MHVDVLATTALDVHPLLDAYGYHPGGHDDDAPVTHADALAEAAGRICYKSFRRPNPATATNDGYLGNILRRAHFSVLEHASVTFLVRGVSRALLAELTRHRHLSFSVVSQRFVNYADTAPVIPPAFDGDAEAEHILATAYQDALMDYEALTARLMDSGATRKQAREAARSVLPNAAPVDLVVTGNVRAWRDVLGKRHDVSADAELQEFAARVLDHLRDVAPNSVQDIPDAPHGSEVAA